ncbi:hypothetical protein [Saccharopolyspora hattusasensis]|uniref:hypothetical protein n=1 Tax=Saccharopolyspora hattusasensis TaxID=1128679 RepID=UPI003D952BED
MRDETTGLISFEPTDDDLRRVWMDNPHLVARVQKWGWEDTEVRDELRAALGQSRYDGSTIGQPVARATTSGERILANEVYVVTPDGKPNRNDYLEYLFVQPDHLWRADWSPEMAGRVKLVRDDHSSPSYHAVWSTAAGLLGVCPYLDPANPFRAVSAEELRVAAASVVDQMSYWSPVTFARVVVPTGFTVHIVQPGLVCATLREHRQHWRVALGLDSDPGA